MTYQSISIFIIKIKPIHCRKSKAAYGSFFIYDTTKSNQSFQTSTPVLSFNTEALKTGSLIPAFFCAR